MKPIHLDAPQREELEARRHQTHDRRLFERLSAVLWAAEGKPRADIADLLGRSLRQIGQWLRIDRNQGLDTLCTIHSKGDPGKLTPAQVQRRKEEIKTGRFHSSDQIRTWIAETWGVPDTASGVKELLRRIGASYHKVTGFLWKGDADKQKRFVQKYQRHKRVVDQTGSQQVRRYFVDACHPIWGLELVYYSLAVPNSPILPTMTFGGAGPVAMASLHAQKGIRARILFAAGSSVGSVPLLPSPLTDGSHAAHWAARSC